MNLNKFDIVENGRLALEALEKKSYDLILMDCHMPVLSGYDATKQIRTQEKKTGHHIPIVAMTSDAMVGTRERCLKTGMDDYISKPLDTEELRHILSRWIKMDEAIPNHTEICTQKSHESDCFDLSILNEFVENEEEVHHFIDIFIEQSAKTIEMLQQNCTEGENWAWVNAAHKLKGGAGMLKAEKLKLLCEQAQEMDPASTAERTEIFNLIQEAYKKVKDNLRKKFPEI